MEQTRDDAEPPVSEIHYLLADGKCRLDLGTLSYIFDAELQVLWAVDHERRSYQMARTPVRMEDHLQEPLLSEFAAVAQDFALGPVEFQRSGRLELIDRWRSELFTLQARGGQRRGVAVELEVWMTDEIALDFSPCKSLDANRLSLSIVAKDYAAQLRELSGFPVLRRARVERGKTVSSTVLRLVSIAEVEPEPSRYTPPERYAERPFSLLERR